MKKILKNISKTLIVTNMLLACAGNHNANKKNFIPLTTIATALSSTPAIISYCALGVVSLIGGTSYYKYKKNNSSTWICKKCDSINDKSMSKCEFCTVDKNGMFVNFTKIDKNDKPAAYTDFKDRSDAFENKEEQIEVETNNNNYVESHSDILLKQLRAKQLKSMEERVARMETKSLLDDFFENDSPNGSNTSNESEPEIDEKSDIIVKNKDKLKKKQTLIQPATNSIFEDDEEVVIEINKNIQNLANTKHKRLEQQNKMNEDPNNYDADTEISDEGDDSMPTFLDRMRKEQDMNKKNLEAKLSQRPSIWKLKNQGILPKFDHSKIKTINENDSDYDMYD